MNTMPQSMCRPSPLPALALLLFAAVPLAHAGDFSFGGKVFADLSTLQQGNHVIGTSTRTSDGDLKRFYLDVDYRFDAAWSAHVTTDINWLRGQSRASDLWVRHAYLQRLFANGARLRLGVDDMPMLSLTSQWWGYRYTDALASSMAKIDSSADWGVHAKWPLHKDLDLAVSVVTGAGYKRPDVGDRADVETVLAWHPGKSWVVALGGYDGRLAATDRAAAPVRHAARRVDALVAWAANGWRLGARYSLGSNWANLYARASERTTVTSAWASRQLTPAWSVFTRVDLTHPNDLTNGARRSRYASLGIEWRATKGMRLALIGKHTALQQGANLQRTGNELGVWSEISF